MQKRAEELPKEGNEKPRGTGRSFITQFPKTEYKPAVAVKVLPVGIVYVGMAAFSNICLSLVDVSFFVTARSLTVVFNVMLSRFILGSSTSLRTIGCLAIVVGGFYIGSCGEVDFSYNGTVAGVMSSLFVSLNAIFSKKMLPVVDHEHWRLTFYNTVNAVILLSPLILYFESQSLLKSSRGNFLIPVFWLTMTAAGILSFSIGIVTVMQIKATTPLSHNISGTVKSAAQSIMACYIWKNPFSLMSIIGMFVVLGGSLLYTIVKMREGKKVHTTTEEKPPEKVIDLELNKA